MPKKYGSVTDACEMANVGRSSYYRYVAAGLLPAPIKLGNKSIVDLEELAERIARQPRATIKTSA